MSENQQLKITILDLPEHVELIPLVGAIFPYLINISEVEIGLVYHIMGHEKILSHGNPLSQFHFDELLRSKSSLGAKHYLWEILLLHGRFFHNMSRLFLNECNNLAKINHLLY